MAFKKLATVTLASANAALSITSIPSTYTDLFIRFQVLAANNVQVVDGNEISFNGVTTNRSNKFFVNSGVSIYPSGSASAIYTALCVASGGTPNTYGAFDIHIPNYSSTAIIKTIDLETAAMNGSANGYFMISNAVWNSTAAINQVTLTCGSGNFAAGSTATVYGI